MEWDQVDPLAIIVGESSRANQALHDYAQMGPGRSLSTLAATYQTRTDPKPPTTQISTLKDWSRLHHWQDRVAAHDDQMRARERQAIAERRERRAQELAERNWQQSADMAKRVAEMLSFPLATVEQVTKRRQLDDGRTTVIEMNVVKPAGWSLRTAAIMADVAAKLGALAVGEPTERTAHTIESMSKKDLESMPLDQLLALRAQLDRG